MRRISLYSLYLFLFLSASCEQATIPETTPDDNDPTVEVLRITSVSLKGNTSVRSIITGTETDPVSGTNTNGKISRLGMYAVCTDGTEYQPANGKNTATYVNAATGKWQPAANLTGDESLRLCSTPVYIHAWHPASLLPSYSNGNFYVTGIGLLTADDFQATGQTDYLYAAGSSGNGGTAGTKTAVTSQNNPGLSFTMKHALAKLTFKMKKDLSIDASETLTLKQIVLKSYGNNFLTGSGSNRRMSLQDGVLSGLVATEKLTYTGDLVLNHTTQDVVALVAPIKDMQRFSFELTVSSANGETRKYQTKALNVSTTWEAGKNYAYTIKADKMSAILEGLPEVTDWTDEKNDIPIQ